jgi:hypothetical protein
LCVVVGVVAVLVMAILIVIGVVFGTLGFL